MHRIRLAIALAAVLCTGPVLAKETSGWVYNGLTGPASLHADDLGDSRFASNSSIGYRWGVVGVEVGHTMSFGRFEDSFDVGGSTYDVDAKLHGWNLGINVNHDIDERWSLQGRAGLFAWDAETRITDPLGARVSADDSGNDWYAGASIDYSWGKRSSIGLGYSRYEAGDAHMDLWGMHSEFRF